VAVALVLRLLRLWRLCYGCCGCGACATGKDSSRTPRKRFKQDPTDESVAGRSSFFCSSRWILLRHHVAMLKIDELRKSSFAVFTQRMSAAGSVRWNMLCLFCPKHKWRKRTRLVAWNCDISSVCKKCQCAGPQVTLEGKSNGRWMTAQASAYPLQFCASLLLFVDS
jgi:hypothetical protein